MDTKDYYIMDFFTNIIFPCNELESYIQYFWILDTNNESILKEKALPSGHVELIFHKIEVRSKNESYNDFNYKGVVIGQHDKSYFIDKNEKAGIIGVVLRPYAAKLLLGVPAGEFLNEQVYIDDLDDAELALLSRKVANSDNYIRAIEHIESFLLFRIRNNKRNYYIPYLKNIIELINTNTNTKSDKLAEHIFLSNKQFTRVFVDNIGIMPKTFSAIVRYQKALKLMKDNSELPMAQVALECEYSDQSHMIRDFRKFTSYTPRKILSSNRGFIPYSSYFGLERCNMEIYNDKSINIIKRKAWTYTKSSSIIIDKRWFCI